MREKKTKAHCSGSNARAADGTQLSHSRSSHRSDSMFGNKLPMICACVLHRHQHFTVQSQTMPLFVLTLYKSLNALPNLFPALFTWWMCVSGNSHIIFLIIQSADCKAYIWYDAVTDIPQTLQLFVAAYRPFVDAQLLRSGLLALTVERVKVSVVFSSFSSVITMDAAWMFQQSWSWVASIYGLGWVWLYRAILMFRR